MWRGLRFPTLELSRLRAVLASAIACSGSIVKGNRVRPATEDRGDFWNPRLSPDGRRVAATIQDGPNQSIWIYDLDGDVPPDVEFGVAAAPWPA